MDNDFYINAIRRFNQGSRQRRALIKTYGCQMNVHDSEKLSAMLLAMGYAQSADKPDIVIFNTCIVRGGAESRIIGNISAYKPMKDANKEMLIVVCGCMTSRDFGAAELIKKCPYIDIIFGTGNIEAFPRLLYEYINTRHSVIDTADTITPESFSYKRNYRHKAYINIIYGCDNFCSYCVVPYVRGRERSRDYKDILKEAEFLVSDGVSEITLLGQNVNSYKGGVSFAELLRQIDQIEGITRIRFMTSHPKDLNLDVIRAMARCKNICPHLHLPLQSGSDKVLKSMNRRYTKEGYLNAVRELKEAIPHISITTDIITGFPGESDNDFNETLDVIERVRFARAFTFIYSKRPDTPAAALPQTSTDTQIKERFALLTDTTNRISLEINREYINKTADVLIDCINDETGILTGRAPCNTLVHISPARGINTGDCPRVLITGAKSFYLTGEVV